MMYVHVDQDTPLTASHFAAAAEREEARCASTTAKTETTGVSSAGDINTNHDNDGGRYIAGANDANADDHHRGTEGGTPGIRTGPSLSTTTARQLEAANREARTTLGYRGMDKVDGWRARAMRRGGVVAGETVKERVGRAYGSAQLRRGDADGCGVGRGRGMLGTGVDVGKERGSGTLDEPFVVE